MDYININWRNGQPFSEMFDDIYYSSVEDEAIAGLSEFDHVFFRNNGLPERWHEVDSFVIAELGLGSGLNCLLTMREWLNQVSDDSKVLHYIAIEKYPLAPQAILDILSRYDEISPLLDEFLRNYPPPVSGMHSRRLFQGRVIIHFRFMDVYDALRGSLLKVDAWFLDGFSPAKNPDMWSHSLFERLSDNSNTGATCSTYTAAGFVRRNLIAAGFEVEKVKGNAAKREMLVARLLDKKPEQYSYSDRPWFNQPVSSGVNEKSAVVIGAGVAGLSVAYALVMRGFDVTIIDDSGIFDDASASDSGSGRTGIASSNPAAVVYPRLSVDNEVDNEFYLSAFCYANYFLTSLQERYHKKFWYGTGLVQYYDEVRIAKIIDRYHFSKQFLSISDDPVSCDRSSRLKRQVAVDIAMAGVVTPAVLSRALIESCGSQLCIINKKVEIMQRVDDKWTCGAQSGEDFMADHVIIADGYAGVLSGMVEFPIDKLRGQVVTLKASTFSEQIRQVCNAGCYITPAIEGRHFLGATFSRDNDNLEIDDKENCELLYRLNQLFPDVFTEASIESSWVGFRHIARDRAPIVGAVPDRDFLLENYHDIATGRQGSLYRSAVPLKNLYVSVAHASRGFTTSFLCAEIVAAQITGEPLPVSKQVLDYLNPSRFIIDELKHG